MEMKDHLQLQTWLNARVPLSEVERVSRFGLCDNERFTERARDAYKLIWTWCGINSSYEQNRFYKRRGMEALDRRIARARRLVNRYLRHDRLFPNA